MVLYCIGFLWGSGRHFAVLGIDAVRLLIDLRCYLKTRSRDTCALYHCNVDGHRNFPPDSPDDGQQSFCAPASAVSRWCRLESAPDGSWHAHSSSHALDELYELFGTLRTCSCCHDHGQTG